VVGIFSNPVSARGARCRAGGVGCDSSANALCTTDQCRPTCELLNDLIRQLVDTPPSEATLRRLFERHRGNLREVFRELFDQAANTTVKMLPAR
jgi:hypothetical protein